MGSFRVLGLTPPFCNFRDMRKWLRSDRALAESGLACAVGLRFQMPDRIVESRIESNLARCGEDRRGCERIALRRSDLTVRATHF